MTCLSAAHDSPSDMTSSATDLLDEDAAFIRSNEPPPEGSGRRALRFVDLFSGCGGLSFGVLEGVRRLGGRARLLAAADADPTAIQVFHRALGGSGQRFLVGDLGNALRDDGTPLTDFGSQLLSRAVGADVIVAGPPCQGHSALNNHTRHDDPRNELYLVLPRAAAALRPKALIIENVKGLAADRRGALTRSELALNDLGYETSWRRVDLSKLGVPQTRTRHVLVATRGERFDWSHLLESDVRRDVAWAIGDLPERDVDDPAHVPADLNSTSRARIDWLFDNHEWQLPDFLRPDCHRNGHSYQAVYGRLWWDRPAQTITSGFTTMGRGRYVHPAYRRTLTPREAARLQCIPDFVRFDGVGRTKAARMIGNVAPPLLTVAIVAELVAQGILTV